MPVNQVAFQPERVFVLLVDDRPTLAFVAVNHREAQELARESWLKEDLEELFSGGKALWSETSKASVRMATDEEVAAYREMAANTDDVSGELLLAYLVPIDMAT